MIRLTKKVCKDYSDAPKQYQSITEEIKNMIEALEAVSLFSTEHVNSAEQDALVHKTGEHCRQVLEDVRKALEKYSSQRKSSENEANRA